MGVYDSLKQYLSRLEQESSLLSFSGIEKLLGSPLPNSAYTYSAWWANGAHSHASAWLDAGYEVLRVNFTSKTVVFNKGNIVQKNNVPPQKQIKKPNPPLVPSVSSADVRAKTMAVCDYTFSYLQDLLPDCDAFGKIIKYSPQNDFNNEKGLPLSPYGKGAFCRFRIKADDWPGVYLWVVDGQIIYIGETAKLQQRFNLGYGNISPRNCYTGGQSTNCKMNKVVLTHYEQGKTVSIFFYQTTDYKQVELDLLNQICTPYNVKDN